MKIELPYSYDEITLEQIQKHNERDISNFEKLIIYTDHSVEYLKSCPQVLIDSAGERLDQILDNVSQKHYKTISIDGVELGFIPNWDKLTAGEYIDLETYCKDPLTNAHKIMAILYRKITTKVAEKYNIVSYDEKEEANIFKRIPASYFTGCMVFFWNIRKELLGSSLVSLAKMGQVNTTSSGGGMKRFSVWLMKRLSKWKK